MRPAREVECEAITAEPDTSVIDVADLLDAHAVGCIVIVDQDRRPQGMVTDRDLMSRVIAAGRDPAKTTAGDIMTTPVVKGSSDETIQELLTRMEEQGVRRIALVEDGRLTALLALDDLVMALSSQLSSIR